MDDLRQQTIFGVPYVVSDLRTAATHFSALASGVRNPVLIAHSDVHVLTRILHEPEYGEGMRYFDYICPDGMPIVWLLRRKGESAHRLYGAAMMEEMWNLGCERGLRHFLLGGSEEACALLARHLNDKYPGAELAGHYCPPMPPWPVGEEERMIEAVRESRANCVWVGLGCPKQERWLFSHRDCLPPALYFGVGAAFNFHAGLVQQAPAWMRNHGLEWLYRILKEPRRLMKRYFVHNSLFIWYCLTRRS